MGALTMKALPFGVFLRAPDFWKLPYSHYLNQPGLTFLRVKPSTQRIVVLYPRGLRELLLFQEQSELGVA